MDAKDLRTEAALGEHRNNGNGKYAQSETTLQCDRGTSHQNIKTNTLVKVDAHSTRPCAVIGPDRVVLPAATNDSYLKNAVPIEPWPCSENPYRRPPDYPYKLADYQHPTRNISPRQTFQENMQRIMMPPRYNPVKSNEDSNYTTDGNIAVHKSNKLNVPSEIDVPYTLNPINSDQRNIRNSELCVSDVNPAIVQNVPPGWSNTGVSVRPGPYGVPELYQYPEYPSCAGSRPIPITRQRMIHEEPSRVYPESYYHERNIRFKPYPIIKERYPQPRYEYVSNYTNPYQPPPFPSHKYDLQKSLPPHAYPSYPQVPFKYMNSRMVEPVMEGYQRANQQTNYNIPFRTQVVHSNYGPVPGNCLQNKFYGCPSDGSVKPIVTNKLPYDNNKMYFEFENTRAKAHTLSENFYANDISRSQKGSLVMPNYGQMNIHSLSSQTYHRKESPQMKSYEYLPHFRYIEPQINNPLSKIPSQFSPNAIAISPTDSNTSNDTTQTLGTSQEDYGYVSQSSSASIRSMDSGVNKTTNDIYKRYDYRYNNVVRNSLLSSKPKLNSNSNINAKDNIKKDIDVRQFLQMWNEGDDEISENNTNKEIAMQAVSQKTNLGSERYGLGNNQEQLYVLGLVNVSSDELSKYEHIQKVSKLPENIKGYNSTELLNQFEEVIESSNLNNFNSKPLITREVPTRKTTTIPQGATIQRPLSPLDVEAKISQSVIHKEVGCNFEIKPCSPKMLNVEIATPIQTLLGERVIEKVSNPHIKSPVTHIVNENNCDTIKSQNQLIPLNENLKTPSCKMVNAQYSTNDNSIKPDYNLQDLEGNSGVCLASLPRLDNDIELNFPEVNQQFIIANKMDSVITTCPKDLPTLDTEQSENIVINDNKQERTFTNFQFSSETETDKEFVKLSKYRKQKKSDLESNVQALRTDSVIIKNPENVKDLDENSELSNNILTTKAHESPINLSPHCETSTKADPEFNNTADTKIKEKECPTNIPSNINLDISIISDSINVDDNSTSASVPSSNCRSLISNNELSIDKEVCPNLTNNDNLSSSTMISNNDTLLERLGENERNSIEAVSNIGKIETIGTKTETTDITAVLNYEPPKIQENDAIGEVLKNKVEIDDHEFVKNIVQNETTLNTKKYNVNKIYSIDEDDLSNKSDGCANFELSQNKTSPNDETLSHDVTKLTFDEKIKSDSTALISAAVPSNVVNKDSDDVITYDNMDVSENGEQCEENSENLDAKERKCTEESNSYIDTDKITSNSLSKECESTHENYSKVCLDDKKIQLGEHKTEIQNTKSLNGDRKSFHEINNEKLEKNVCLKTFQHIHKELYSPWIQKLLMYNEGNYIRLFDDNLMEKSYLNFNQTKDLDIKAQPSSHLMFSTNETNNVIRKSEISNMEKMSNVVSTTVKINCAIHSDDEFEKGRKDCSNYIEDNVRQENETIDSICDNEDSEPMQTRRENDDLTEASIEIDVINAITSTIERSNTIDISKSQFRKDTTTNNTIQLPQDEDTSLKSKCDEYNKKSNCKNVYQQREDQFPYKQNLLLKRSLSDSALNGYCDDDYYTNSKQKLLEKTSSLWPNKRKKIMDSQNTIETQIITGNFCNIIQNNRRNSVSSIYNEEAVSFCILIEDDNCIIAEETEDSDKVCFTEIISENSLPDLETTETINDEDEKNVQTTLEVMTSQDESNCDYSNSLVFECLEEKMLQDSWVEDVACVETVISEEIAADVTISASGSPENISEYICNGNNEDENFDIAIDQHEEVMDRSGNDNINDNDYQFSETNITPVIDINGSLKDRKSQIVEHNTLLEKTFSEAKQVDTPPNELFHSLFYSSDSIQFDKKENEKDTTTLQYNLSKFGNKLFQNDEQTHIQPVKHQDDTVHSCESSVDNVFSYREKEEFPKYRSSSSPEVSSTTSEEKKSSILLKITNYKGSRMSQVNNFENNENNRPSFKFTEEKYLNSNDNLSTIRPLLTKAAQKYIPPLKETMRNFKVKLPLPQDSLIRLKQLKKSKEEPKPVINFNLNRHNNNVTRQEFPKRQKPNFEDVLKSIDEIQFKMHKERTKKAKKFIPKVVIKKRENGSHYTSTSDKDAFNPDLTGSKWQPWVFLERNIFVDEMALKGKTRAIFSHRQNRYVLAEKFQRYKSIDSTNFIISQASLSEPKGQLKYTIRLQNRY